MISYASMPSQRHDFGRANILPLSNHMIIKLILLGVLQVTSYCPRAQETKPSCTSRDHCRTSIDDGVTKFGVAVFQDILKNGSVNFWDILYIERYDYSIVKDFMN